MKVSVRVLLNYHPGRRCTCQSYIREAWQCCVLVQFHSVKNFRTNATWITLHDTNNTFCHHGLPWACMAKTLQAYASGYQRRNLQFSMHSWRGLSGLFVLRRRHQHLMEFLELSLPQSHHIRLQESAESNKTLCKSGQQRQHVINMREGRKTQNAQVLT